MTSHNKEDIHLLCDYTFNIIEGKVREVKEKEGNSDANGQEQAALIVTPPG